ncbi:MBL fold metallo-hydrolase [Candidatus Aerophobetes bacterium]|nr:MBL fold metallo-hydrolase [Candidatus Aerophobetes bacterium]
MGKIEITFLGTTAGIPTLQRAHPAIYLRYEGREEFCCLFDCGEGTQRQMLFAGLNFMKIGAIFITHWHPDHYLGLAGLVDTMSFEERKSPLIIFSPELERTKMFLSLEYHNKRPFEIIYKKVPTEGKKASLMFQGEEFSILSIPVVHTVPAVAYVFVEKDRIKIDKKKLKEKNLPLEGEIYRQVKEKGKVFFNGKEIFLKDISTCYKGKKVVYSGDTRICDNLIQIAKDADLLIQDCTYFDAENFEKYEHACLDEIVGFLKKVKVGKVILTHISRRYTDLEQLKEKIKEYPQLEIARDFMKICI